MTSLRISLLAAAVACATLPMAKADASICDAVSGNLVKNCGFEGGVYSSTLGNPNGSVPNYWTPNAGYDLVAGFNHVTGSPVYSGSYALSIGNFDFQQAPSLSQTLTDVANDTYSGSLYVAYGGAGGGDTGAFFNVLIDNRTVPVLSLDDTASLLYTQYTFSFTGTGSDVLTLEGNTNPSEWYVDDVVVTGAVPPVPEPGFYGALTLSFSGLLFAGWRRRRRA